MDNPIIEISKDIENTELNKVPDNWEDNANTQVPDNCVDNANTQDDQEMDVSPNICKQEEKIVFQMNKSEDKDLQKPSSSNVFNTCKDARPKNPKSSSDNTLNWRNKTETKEPKGNANYPMFYNRQQTNNKFKEVKGDLFSVSNEYSLCHCVAEDLTMGAGIAVTFRDKFKRIAELLEQQQTKGGLAYLKDGNRFIYYLITKMWSTGKPVIKDLEKSLLKMRQHMIENDIKKLAMPKIGCGLDRLNWWDVSDLINYVFNEDDVDILVYEYDKEDADEEQIATPGHKSWRTQYRTHPLVGIETQTLLIFTVSTQNEITPQMRDLDKKFGFITEFTRQRKRSVGEYYFTEKKNEWIVGLYVKAKPEDPFSFVAFQKALRAALKDHKGVVYIGIDTLKNERDFLIMEKIQTLFKFYFSHNYQLFICDSPPSENESRY